MTDTGDGSAIAVLPNVTVTLFDPPPSPTLDDDAAKETAGRSLSTIVMVSVDGDASRTPEGLDSVAVKVSFPSNMLSSMIATENVWVAPLVDPAGNVRVPLTAV